MSVEIIFKKENGKTKGVSMSDEENNMPEIVGLSKKQFFGFLFAAILLGAGMFGMGYTSNYFTKKQENKEKTHEHSLKNSINNEMEKLGMKKQHEENQIDYSNQYFISLGTFTTQDQAKHLTKKLKELGKNAQIKQSRNYFLVYIGPYNSYSYAESETNSIASASSLRGSIMKGLS